MHAAATQRACMPLVLQAYVAAAEKHPKDPEIMAGLFRAHVRWVLSISFLVAVAAAAAVAVAVAVAAASERAGGCSQQLRGHVAL